MGRTRSPSDDLSQRVRQIVTRLLGGDSLDVRLVAEMLGKSVRTLQRRMRLAGLTYSGIVLEARCTVAHRMLLEDPGRKIGDVARAVGYSDPAHFTRAFQRWAGVGPRELRRRARRPRRASRGPAR